MAVAACGTLLLTRSAVASRMFDRIDDLVQSEQPYISDIVRGERLHHRRKNASRESDACPTRTLTVSPVGQSRKEAIIARHRRWIRLSSVL